ncbi:TPA: hypothetical protein QIR73_002106 [Enterobacter cloacae]|nr:hypothetical protein [Enterobacter cloacae]
MTSTLTDLSSRDQFRLMLQQYPRLANYWDTQDDRLLYLELKKAVGVLSHGEQIMARFYMSVWRHENHDFDILDAAAHLGEDEKRIVMTWFAAPFWP